MKRFSVSTHTGVTNFFKTVRLLSAVSKAHSIRYIFLISPLYPWEIE